MDHSYSKKLESPLAKPPITAAEHEARVVALTSELTSAWEGRVKQREADLTAGFDEERKEMKRDHANKVEALVRGHEEEREALTKKLRDSGDALHAATRAETSRNELKTYLPELEPITQSCLAATLGLLA